MGMRFTDAHTPSSRCSPTRYGLLTGRYPWRNRLKHWVLFGSQGDPMIEADRQELEANLKLLTLQIREKEVGQVAPVLRGRARAR